MDSQDGQDTKGEEGEEAQAIRRVNHRRIQGLKKPQGRTTKSVVPKRTHMCKKIWKEQQKPGFKGKHYSICGLHKLTGISNSTLR